MDRSLIFVIDDFTDRVYEYPNTILFDYGRTDVELWYDNYVNPFTGITTGYGTYDTRSLYSTGIEDFYAFFPDFDVSLMQSWINYPTITPTTFLTTSAATYDYDFVQQTQFLDINGILAYEDAYNVFRRLDETSHAQEKHGDWVVNTIYSNLDDPARTTIVCIDVDTLNGTNAHYTKLFELDFFTSLVTGEAVTKFEAIIYQTLLALDERFGASTSDKYVVGGLSMSISGPASTMHGVAIKTFEQMGSLIFQSAPNVNNGDYDWGQNFQDVINVGAWNTDAAGNLLIASEATLPTVDIVANGYVTHPSWGSTFGTSFATPMVAAEYLNLLNNLLAQNETANSGLAGNTGDTNVEFNYADLVNGVLDAISTSIFYDTSNNYINDPASIRLSNETIQLYGIDPLQVTSFSSGMGTANDTTGLGLTNYSLQNVAYDDNTVGTFTDLTFTGGKHYVGKNLSASVSIEDANGTSNSLISYIWYRINDDSTYSSITSGPTYVVSQLDVGKRIGVSANFLDDDGYLELSNITYFPNTYVINAELTLNSPANVNLTEDSQSSSIGYTGTSIITDNLQFSFSDPVNGSLQLNNGTYVYVPDPDYFGTDTFIITVNDGVETVSQEITVNISPTPDDPVLTTSSTISVNEDTASNAIAFSATDVDGDTLTYTFSTPTKGAITRDDVNGTYVYTPNTDENGSDSFTVSVTDGTVTVTETVNITINAINDDPVLTTSNTITIDEDTPSSAIAFSATDVDGDALTYTFSTPTKGTITRDDVNGTYVYTPNADENGSDSFTIAVNDGAETVTETVNVTITAVNDDPILTTSNTILVNEDTASTAIAFSATDVDRDTLTYTFSTPTKGTITRDDANGTYVYNPNTNANGSDSFTISVTDGTVTVTETINVSIFNLVEGTLSDDTLSGSSGSDNISGLSGHDVITGNLGDDWLSGGLGNDIFHFASSGDGHDTIYAFEHDVDQIKFDGVSYVVGDPDNYAGITETTNGNGDTVIQYGGSSSITLTDAIASSPFELVELSSDRYGDIFTFGLRLKDDPSTTSSDTQIVSEFNDIDIEIGWTSGEFSYWGGYRYGQNDIYDTANSGAGLNLASSNLSPGNPNATTLNLTYSEAGNLAISENDYLATFMLERSDTSSAQNNSITLKTSQGKVLDTTSQQLVSLPTSQTPRSYEFNFANDTVDIQLGTFRGNAAPNPVVFVSNDSVSDGLALRVIEKIGDLLRYEIILNISDATFKGGEAFASHHKIKVKDAIILDNTIALKSDLANAEGAELTSNGYLAEIFLDQVDKTASVSQLSTEQDEQNAFLNDIILPNDANPITETNFDTSSTLEFRASNLALPSSVGFATNYTGSNGSYVLAEFLAYGPTISFESGRSNNFSNLVLGNEINISREIDGQSVAHSGVWSETVRDSAIISVIGDGYHLDLGNSSDVVDAGDALGVLRAIIDAAQNSPENRIFTTKHYIAGDFNSDGRLSAADAYEILSYSIFGNTQGTVFPQWVYVSDLVSNTSTFSDIHYEEPIGITTDNLGSLDVTAILKGDLSFSYSDTNFQGNLVEGLIAEFESALIL